MSWALHRGVRRWVGGKFPDPPQHELDMYKPAAGATTPEEHGTRNARLRHRRRGEDYCATCRRPIANPTKATA